MFDALTLNFNHSTLPVSKYFRQYALSLPIVTSDAGAVYRGFWDNPSESNAIKIQQNLYSAYIFAKATFNVSDLEKLEAAYLEASALITSGAFGVDIFPSVGIDQYGEIILSQKLDSGYIDIGCRGEGELSYHIRNDRDPNLSAFGDVDFSESIIPADLIDALAEL